jgi:hypothetical protein
MGPKYLVGALTNYSSRSGGKVVFRNGLSLNKLALAMWEQAPSCGIDASILSKVLNGKRAFTPHQLSVFCTVLGIQQGDREYLFYCLHKDQCLKSGADFGTPFIAPSGTHSFVEGLMRQADVLFEAGKWKDLYDLCEVIRAYLQDHVAIIYQHDPEDPLVAVYQTVMYLYAKSAIVTSSQGAIVSKIGATARAFKRYPNSASAHLIPGYVAALKAAAYRVLGVFPSPRTVSFDPETAILSGKYAAEAIRILPPLNLEYFEALRSATDSAINLGKQEMFLGYTKIAKREIFRPGAHALGSLQLTATVGKGMAVFGIGDPFALRIQAERHFERTFTGARFLELSDIKTELEIYIALRSKRDRHIEQRVQRALNLADEESVRYRAIITRLAEQL